MGWRKQKCTKSCNLCNNTVLYFCDRARGVFTANTTVTMQERLMYYNNTNTITKQEISIFPVHHERYNWVYLYLPDQRIILRKKEYKDLNFYKNGRIQDDLAQSAAGDFYNDLLLTVLKLKGKGYVVHPMTVSLRKEKVSSKSNLDYGQSCLDSEGKPVAFEIE